MVSHARLQYYRHNYCLVCVTGVYGCRWHRYRQSTKNSRKRDLVWTIALLLTFLYVSFLLYFWLIADNDSDDLNWYMFNTFTLKWIPWYTICLALTGAAFAYLVILMILSLCHVIHGHQLYIHPVHLVVIFFIFCGCVATTNVVNALWDTEWAVIKLSFLIIGPFLHIGLVVLLTLLTWVFMKHWILLSRLWLKFMCLLVFLCVMIGLYIVPLFIDSPCIQPKENLPRKPLLFAHRGASGIAPENTLIAFQIAAKQNVFGLESDVQISHDGVLFMMHDLTLRRTTNIAEVYPDKINADATSFTYSQLSQLNAGSWFMKKDPMGMAGSLSQKEKNIYNNQTIPTLTQFIQYANYSGKSVMFDIRYPPQNHPYYKKTTNQILETILNIGIPLHKIWWLTSINDELLPSGLTLTGTNYLPAKKLYNESIFYVNMQYDPQSVNYVRDYLHMNITTNIYVINSKWFFSLFWCLGVHSVTTNDCHILNKMTSPLWYLPPTSYLVMWVSTDVISALFIVIIYVVRRIRLYGTRFNPETISLHSQQKLTGHHHAKIMKEKLLFKTDYDEVEINNGNILDENIMNYGINSVSGHAATHDGNKEQQLEFSEVRLEIS